jgi:hypothetical protein
MQQYVDQLSAAQREIEQLRANRSPPKDKITRESSRNTQDANNQTDSSAFPSNLSALPCTPAKKPAYVHTYVPRQNKGANGSNEEETKPIGVSDFDTEKTPKRACGVSMSTSSRDVATSAHAHSVRGRPVRILDLCQSYDMDSDMDIQETEYEDDETKTEQISPGKFEIPGARISKHDAPGRAVPCVAICRDDESVRVVVAADGGMYSMWRHREEDMFLL